MKIGYITAPTRPSASAFSSTAGASAAPEEKAASSKNGGGTRPPMHPQRKPSRATSRAAGARVLTALAPPDETDSDMPDSAEKKVHDLVLAFFRRADAGRLYSRERVLLSDISDIVRQLIAERDEARLQAEELFAHIERIQFSAAAIARWEKANDDIEELEEKPAPTMWQLIAAGYANDPELAEAWNDLQDDPELADLHEPAVRSLADQMRAHLRLDQD